MTQLGNNHKTYQVIRDDTYPKLVKDLNERVKDFKSLQNALEKLKTDLEGKDKDSAQAIVDTFRVDETYLKFLETTLYYVDDLESELEQSKNDLLDLKQNMGNIDSSHDDLNVKMEKLFKSYTNLQSWLHGSRAGTAIMKKYITILNQFLLQCQTLEQEQTLLNEYRTEVDQTKQLVRTQTKEIDAEGSKLLNMFIGLFSRTSEKSKALNSARALFESLSKEIVTFTTTADSVQSELTNSFDTLHQYSTVAETMLEIGQKLSDFEFEDVTIPDPTESTQIGVDSIKTLNDIIIERVGQVLQLKELVDKSFKSANEALSFAKQLQEQNEGINAGKEAGEPGNEPGKAANEPGTAGTEPGKEDPDESKKLKEAIVNVIMDIQAQDVSFKEQCKQLQMFLHAHTHVIAKMVELNPTLSEQLGQLKQIQNLWSLDLGFKNQPKSLTDALVYFTKSASDAKTSTRHTTGSITD